MYSLQKKAPGPLALKGPTTVTRGTVAHFVAAVPDCSGPQVFGFSVFDPDGRRVWKLRKNVRTTGVPALAEFDFEAAFNERPGVWRIVVRHVNTGTEKECRLRIE